MANLNIPKVTKLYQSEVPGISPELAQEICSKLNVTLAGLLEKPFSMTAYCEVKIKHLEWLLEVLGNPKAEQTHLRSLLTEIPFVKTVYRGIIGQLKDFAPNAEQRIADAGYKSESAYIMAVLLTEEKLAQKYQSGDLTIADVLMIKPGLLLNNA